MASLTKAQLKGRFWNGATSHTINLGGGRAVGVKGSPKLLKSHQIECHSSAEAQGITRKHGVTSHETHSIMKCIEQTQHCAVIQPNI